MRNPHGQRMAALYGGSKRNHVMEQEVVMSHEVLVSPAGEGSGWRVGGWREWLVGWWMGQGASMEAPVPMSPSTGCDLYN